MSKQNPNLHELQFQVKQKEQQIRIAKKALKALSEELEALEDAVNRKKHPGWVKCKTCGGTGDSWERNIPCSACLGKGEELADADIAEVCPKCSGVGKKKSTSYRGYNTYMTWTICGKCWGKGRV